MRISSRKWLDFQQRLQSHQFTLRFKQLVNDLSYLCLCDNVNYHSQLNKKGTQCTLMFQTLWCWMDLSISSQSPLWYRLIVVVLWLIYKAPVLSTRSDTHWAEVHVAWMERETLGNSCKATAGTFEHNPSQHWGHCLSRTCGQLIHYVHIHPPSHTVRLGARLWHQTVT